MIQQYRAATTRRWKFGKKVAARLTILRYYDEYTQLREFRRRAACRLHSAAAWSAASSWWWRHASRRSGRAVRVPPVSCRRTASSRGRRAPGKSPRRKLRRRDDDSRARRAPRDTSSSPEDTSVPFPRRNIIHTFVCNDRRTRDCSTALLCSFMSPTSIAWRGGVVIRATDLRPRGSSPGRSVPRPHACNNGDQRRHMGPCGSGSTLALAF